MMFRAPGVLKLSAVRRTRRKSGARTGESCSMRFAPASSSVEARSCSDPCSTGASGLSVLVPGEAARLLSGLSVKCRSTLELVESFPGTGARIPMVTGKARRLPVAGFPYHVVFEELHDRVEVRTRSKRRDTGAPDGPAWSGPRNSQPLARCNVGFQRGSGVTAFCRGVRLIWPEECPSRVNNSNNDQPHQHGDECRVPGSRSSAHCCSPRW